MAGDKLRSYKRIHGHEHPTDEEGGKISRDLNSYTAHAKRQDRLIDKLLENPLDDDMAARLGDSVFLTVKHMRKFKTHKARLKDLERDGLE